MTTRTTAPHTAAAADPPETPTGRDAPELLSGGSATPSIGLAMKLYRNTNTFAVPTWTLVPNVTDLKMNPGEPEPVEVGFRGTAPFQQYEPGLKAASYEWDMLWRQADTDLAAFIAAWQAGTLIEFAFADGLIATTGTTYFRHECKIFSISRDEPLNDKCPTHLIAKPCFSTNAPTFNTV